MKRKSYSNWYVFTLLNGTTMRVEFVESKLENYYKYLEDIQRYGYAEVKEPNLELMYVTDITYLGAQRKDMSISPALVIGVVSMLISFATLTYVTFVNWDYLVMLFGG